MPSDGRLDHFFQPLLFRTDIPEEVLLDLVRQRRSISAIGHREGPQSVLEACLEQDPPDETVCTLLNNFYGLEAYPLESLLDFVRNHSDVIKSNIDYIELDPNRHAALLQIIQGLEEKIKD